MGRKSRKARDDSWNEWLLPWKCTAYCVTKCVTTNYRTHDYDTMIKVTLKYSVFKHSEVHQLSINQIYNLIVH